MPSFRPLMIAIIQLYLLAMISNSAVAQLQKLTYQPGDTIEVKFHNQWFQAEVTEIMAGGMALKADFTDARGRERNWMFSSRQIRKIEETIDPVPEGDTEDIAEFPVEVAIDRTWKTASGKFSVEAKFVSKNGNEVELLTTDGRSVTVSLSELSPDDKQYVEEALKPATTSGDANPFVISKPEKAATSETGSGSSDVVERDSVHSERRGRDGRDRFSPSAQARSEIDESSGLPNNQVDSSGSPRSNLPANESAADSSRPKPSDSSRISPPQVTFSDKPGVGQPAKPNSRSLWRWIACFALFTSGAAMFAWGYANRNLYW